MKVQFVLLLFIAFALTEIFAAKYSKKDRKVFEEWCEKHHKQYYTQEEEDKAMKNVLMHKRKIDAHNRLYKRGKKSHPLKLNEHSDMTMEENFIHPTWLHRYPPVYSQCQKQWIGEITA